MPQTFLLCAKLFATVSPSYRHIGDGGTDGNRTREAPERNQERPRPVSRRRHAAHESAEATARRHGLRATQGQPREGAAPRERQGARPASVDQGREARAPRSCAGVRLMDAAALQTIRARAVLAQAQQRLDDLCEPEPEELTEDGARELAMSMLETTPRVITDTLHEAGTHSAYRPISPVECERVQAEGERDLTLPELLVLVLHGSDRAALQARVVLRDRLRGEHAAGAGTRAVGGMSMHVPNRYRVRTGYMGSSEAEGNNGAFFIPRKPGLPQFKVIASDGEGWEHVSVSLPDRVPTWSEMCELNDIFWDAEDCVVQFHPPRSDYVNNHSRCLHMWRPVGIEMPRPPAWMVGDATLGTLT